MKLEPSPLMIAVFRALRERGFPLGIADYHMLLEGIAAGFAETRDDLRSLCQCLWAKSAEEQKIVGAVFDVILPISTVQPTSAPKPQVPASRDLAAQRPSQAPLENAAKLKASPAFPGAIVRLRFMQGRAEVGAIAASLVRVDGRPMTLHPGIILAGDLPITRRQMNRAWRHHRRMQRRGVRTEIDFPATITQMARTGVLLAPVLVPRRVNLARMLILQDEGGSMTPFRRITRSLCESALQGGLARVDIAWFHDVPSTVLYRDSAMTQTAPIERVTEPFRDSSILIVSDGGAARGQLDLRRVDATIAALRQLRAFTQNIAWINPTPIERWSGSTAGRIAAESGVPMFPLTRRGLDATVSVLRGRSITYVSAPLQSR